MQTLYLSVDISGSLPSRCCAVNVSGLLRELIIYTIALGSLDSRVPEQSRLAGVLLDQLMVLPTIPLRLPSPADPRKASGGVVACTS